MCQSCFQMCSSRKDTEMDFCIKTHFTLLKLLAALLCTGLQCILMSLLYNFGSSYGETFFKTFGALPHGHHAVLKRNLTLFDTNFEVEDMSSFFFIPRGIIQRQCQGWFIIKTFFSNYPGYLEREERGNEVTATVIVPPYFSHIY